MGNVVFLELSQNKSLNVPLGLDSHARDKDASQTVSRQSDWGVMMLDAVIVFMYSRD